MNYNALLLIDRIHNNKISYSTKASNINQYSFLKHKNNNIKIHNEDKEQYQKCYSVKPYLYMMPKDIIIKDIFQKAIKSSNEYIKYSDLINNATINNNTNIDRQYIFEKIKKFILINHINFNILGKTIFLYDLLLLKRENMDKTKYFSNFYSLSNLSIALIAFILILKFNNEEKKMISLKKLVKKFEEGDENIIFNEVCEMEIMALQLIDYNLTFQTPFSFMDLFLLNGILFNEDYINSDWSFNIYDLVNKTLERIMEKSNEYFKYNFFYLCCSVIMHIREKFNLNRWPKALEITFDVNYEQFYDTYKIFFVKNNKNTNIYSGNNIKNFCNVDIINIINLKSMNNIISVLKIMKSADKFKKNKEKNQLDKEENCKNNKNICLDINNSNKIKVGIKNKKNLLFFKSPDKFTMAKSSISNILSKLNEENKNNFSNLYNKKYNKENEKENENENENDINNKNIGQLTQNNEENQITINDKNNFSGELYKKESFNIVEKDKIKATKSCNRYKKKLNITNKNAQENSNITNKNIKITNDNNDDNYNNNSNIDGDGNYSKKTSNPNIYRKRYYFSKKSNNFLNDYPDENKEIQNDINNRNMNSSIKKIILRKKISNRYYNNYTSKKRSHELNNEIKNNNLNVTAFNDFLFYKNKKNKNNDTDVGKDKNNKDYLGNLKIKNKEENSNAPTCESSNIKISSNDYSIRKSYRLKKKYTKNAENEKLNLSPKKENNKTEKEGRKLLEKNKSYNKLMDNNMPFSDKTYNRKTGVRKFYKQKNLLENH